MILLNFQEHQKSINFNKNYKDKNEQHFQILKVLFLCGILGGLYFNTRLNCKACFSLQNRMPGFVAERCRWQMQRGEDGAAVKIWRNTAIFWAPQEGLRSNFKSFCPCQKTVTIAVTVSLDMVNFLIQSIFRPRFSQCRIGNYKVGEPACRNRKPYKCNAEMRCKNQCYG